MSFINKNNNEIANAFCQVYYDNLIAHNYTEIYNLHTESCSVSFLDEDCPNLTVYDQKMKTIHFDKLIFRNFTCSFQYINTDNILISVVGQCSYDSITWYSPP